MTWHIRISRLRTESNCHDESLSAVVERAEEPRLPFGFVVARADPAALASKVSHDVAHQDLVS